MWQLKGQRHSAKRGFWNANPERETERLAELVPGYVTSSIAHQTLIAVPQLMTSFWSLSPQTLSVTITRLSIWNFPSLSFHPSVYNYFSCRFQLNRVFLTEGFSNWKIKMLKGYSLISFFLVLLRYSWQNCKIFKVYIMVIWYAYALWKESHHLVN